MNITTSQLNTTTEYYLIDGYWIPLLNPGQHIKPTQITMKKLSLFAIAKRLVGSFKKKAQKEADAGYCVCRPAVLPYETTRVGPPPQPLCFCNDPNPNVSVTVQNKPIG